MGEKTTMGSTQITPQMISCGGPLPELEIPMINTMVNCLTIEHRRLDELNMRLAYAATGLAGDPGAVTTYRRAIEAWDEIQRRLWSHLQIEDELVLTWGRAHQAMSDEMIDSLAAEHQRFASWWPRYRYGPWTWSPNGRLRIVQNSPTPCWPWPKPSIPTSSATRRKSCLRFSAPSSANRFGIRNADRRSGDRTSA
jgi:hypothetical protein